MFLGASRGLQSSYTGAGDRHWKGGSDESGKEKRGHWARIGVKRQTVTHRMRCRGGATRGKKKLASDGTMDADW